MTIPGDVRVAEAPERADGGTSVARRSAVVAGWTLVSRVTGLLRVVVIGAVLGPTFLANTFLAANTVPQMVYSMVAGPVLALVVVPSLVRALIDRGTAACALHVRRLSGLLLTASGAVALAMVPVSLGLGWLLTAGVPEADRGRAVVVAVVLLLLVVPQVPLYTLATLGAAAQQARERFPLAAAAPALENVGLMLTMGAVAMLYRPGPDIGDVPYGFVVLLGLGATLSTALHAGVQAWGARRVGLSIRPAGGWRRDPEVRAVARRLRGSVLVAGLPSVAYFVLLAVAATVPGGVLVLQMAYSVYVLPTALGARAISTTVLPGMSAAVVADDRAGYAASWRQALSYAAMIGLPTAAIMAAFAGPAATVLAAGELRTDAIVTSLTVCIAILAAAQAAAGVHEIGRQALFARLDTRGPQRAGWVGFAVTAAAGAAALLLPAGLPRLAALGMAVLLADVAAAGTVVALVRRAVRPERGLDRRGLASVAVSVVAMLPVLWAGWWLVRSGGGTVRDTVVAALAAGLAIAVFAGALRALHFRRGAT
jgi:peptidoglycan biosynthesis protein MviN/MurJ (putative lipid II flippase)